MFRYLQKALECYNDIGVSALTKIWCNMLHSQVQGVAGVGANPTVFVPKSLWLWKQIWCNGAYQTVTLKDVGSNPARLLCRM
jgi:hypothetical protein